MPDEATLHKCCFLRERSFPSSNVSHMVGEVDHIPVPILHGRRLKKLAYEEMRLLRLLGLITDTGEIFTVEYAEIAFHQKLYADYFGSQKLLNLQIE